MTPRILVPGRRLAAGRAGRQEAVVAGSSYLEAIVAAGAIEMVIGPRPLAELDEADAVMGQAHGLLLLGGADVDPARYGATPHPQTYGADGEQDDFEIALVAAAGRLGLPVLAICRGLQLVNVAFGGTLDQHLGDTPGLLAHAPATFPKAEPGSIGALLPVSIAPGCRLHRMLADPAEAAEAADPAEQAPITVVGAHSHHQAVARLGDGLTAVGHSADGVVEAIEHRDRWLVAAQWHPEDTVRDDQAMQRLFAGFVDEARRRAR